MQKNESMMIILSGGIIGIIASCLVYFGNPMNMGFCIACFLRDTAGGLGLHSTATVQYIRPEIIGLILGSFIINTFYIGIFRDDWLFDVLRLSF